MRLVDMALDDPGEVVGLDELETALRRLDQG